MFHNLLDIQLYFNKLFRKMHCKTDWLHLRIKGTVYAKWTFCNCLLTLVKYVFNYNSCLHFSRPTESFSLLTSSSFMIMWWTPQLLSHPDNCFWFVLLSDTLAVGSVRIADLFMTHDAVFRHVPFRVQSPGENAKRRKRMKLSEIQIWFIIISVY